ncbi:AsmA family protein [Flavisphingomonas formosensis]|uniref:AsmA family protein n=1 Tax=Flavisphingomonas formosensis TaxID=861534 RepID=UPI0012FAADD2|nr:AsmA family protein [Sphingomonas formosensis]
MADADPPPPREPALRIRRVPETPIAAVIAVLSTIIGLILLAWTILFVTKGRFLKHPFERIVSHSTGRVVKVPGDFQLYFDPIDVKFVAEGMTISNPAWAKKPYFFQARRIDTRIASIPLIFGRKRVNWLDLLHGDVNLEWDARHKRNTWTFGDPDAPGKPLEMPVIRRAIMSGTTLHYTDPMMQLTTDIQFETIKAADTQFAGAIRFAGDGHLRDRRFTLSGALQSPNETLAGGRNQFTMHAVSGGNILDVSGALPGATVIEGADLAMKVRGPNLARLFDFLGVAVPDTRAYHFRSHLTKEGGAWKFTRLAGAFGDSDLAGGMTITMPDNRLKIDADLASRSVDIVDIGPFIGYEPQALASKGVVAAVAQKGDHPRILPDAPLRVDAISRFDAHVDYKVTDIKAPHLPISNVALTLDLDHSLLKLSPLTMDLSRGHVASDIVLDARQRPAFTDYDIRLSPTPMGTLLAGFGVDESGTSGVVKARIKMSGRGDTVHDSLASANGRIVVILPKGSFWTRNIQLSELDIGTFLTKLIGHKLKKPVQINCGLIGFTVRDGVAAADPILIDTDKNVITGRGGFSFKDESLDFSVRADGKTFSLFSAQSPVGLDGYFAKPGLRIISPQLLTRAGIGIGLGVVATPVAALIAFVDPGDAKAAACGPVLAGADASAQRTTKGKPRKDVGNGKPLKR